MPRQSTIDFIKGLRADLDSFTLLSGEPAVTTDTHELFIGDGVTNRWIGPMRVARITVPIWDGTQWSYPWVLQKMNATTGVYENDTLSGTGHATPFLYELNGNYAATPSFVTVRFRGRTAGGVNIYEFDRIASALLPGSPFTRVHTLDSWLALRGSHSHTLTSWLSATHSHTHALTSWLATLQSQSHTLTSWLANLEAQSHTLDSWLASRGSKTHTLDSLLYATLSKTHTVTSWLATKQAQTHTLDSWLALLETKAHTLDSYARGWRIYDKFNVADATNNARTPDTFDCGTTWSNIIGTMSVVSNALKVTTYNSNLCRTVIDNGFPVSTIKADFTLPNTAVRNFFFLVFRYVDNTNHWYGQVEFATGGPSNNKFLIVETTANSASVKATSATVTISPATTYTMSITDDGNNIAITVNGVTATFASTSKNTATKCGIFIQSNDAGSAGFTTIDEFRTGLFRPGSPFSVTHTLTSWKATLQSKTNTVDSWLAALRTKTHTVTSWLAALASKTHTIDSDLAGLESLSHTMDSYLVHIPLTVYIHDTFTDTNGTALGSHTPDVGGPWTNVTGLEIDSNTLTCGASPGPGGHGEIDIGHTAFTATVDFRVAPIATASGNRNFVFRWRYADTTHCLSVTLFFASGSDTATSYDVRDEFGMGTSVSIGTGTGTFTAGVTYTLTVTDDGTAITTDINGVGVSASTSDNSGNTVMRLDHVSTVTTTAVPFIDNLLVTQ